MAAKRKDRRSRVLAAIHVLKHKLGLDDELYRDVVQRVAGKRSAAELTDAERSRLLDELRRQSGEQVRRMRDSVPAPGAPQVRKEVAGMVAKIGAMLAEAGRPWTYAQSMARRMFGVQRIEWLTPEQMRRLIAALTYDQKRRRQRAAEEASDES